MDAKNVEMQDVVLWRLQLLLFLRALRGEMKYV